MRRDIWLMRVAPHSRSTFDDDYYDDDHDDVYDDNIVIVIVIIIVIEIIFTRSSRGLTVPSAATQGWEACSSTSRPPTIPDRDYDDKTAIKPQ